MTNNSSNNITKEKNEEAQQEIVLINTEVIQNKIYTIRGQKVMLDMDLAEIYGYETKNLNRQVKNNSTKFEGEDFVFQLNDKEILELSRCKNFTLNKEKGRGNNIKENQTLLASVPVAFEESDYGCRTNMAVGEGFIVCEVYAKYFERTYTYFVDIETGEVKEIKIP